MDDYFGDKSNSINFISVAHDQSGNFSGIESNIPDVFNLDNSTSGTLVENMDISSQCLDLRKKKLEVLEKNWKSGNFTCQKITIPIQTAKEKTGVYCLQYNEDKIVLGMKNGKIVIFQLPDYQYLYTLSGHKSSVTCLFIDEKKIVSGSSDESMIIWDISTRAVLQQITDHKSRIVKLKFDQDILISCSKDCCLLVHNIFDVSNVKMVKNLALNESQLDNQKLICNAADINKEYLAVGLNNKIGVWERKENFRLLPLIEAHEGFVTGLLVLNDDILISGSNDKTVCFQI